MQRGEPLRPHPLHGPPPRQTTLASILAAEMEVPIVQDLRARLERAADLAGLLTNLDHRAVSSSTRSTA